MSHLQGEEGTVGEVHSCLHGGREGVHMTIAIDPVGRRKTERIWFSGPPIVKDVYVTLEAVPFGDTQTRATVYATFQPRIPVISHLLTPVFIRLMRSAIEKDMRGLREFCETGKVAGREDRKAEAGV